jgi:hypothetical protein
VQNNPANRVDPSGLITEAEAPEADRILESLRDRYNIDNRGDWGPLPYSQIYTADLTGVLGCEWQKGSWRSIEELRWVMSSVTSMASKMGGSDHVRNALEGRVDISRVSGNRGSFAPPGVLAFFLGEVFLSDDSFSTEDYAKFTVAHELGHVWDHRSEHRLSRGLMEALETWICGASGSCSWSPYQNRVDPSTLRVEYPEPAPGADPACWGPTILSGCSEPYAATYGWGGKGPLERFWRVKGWWPGWEDWGDSFASYVFPNYFPARGLVGLLPIRMAYVQAQIDGLE